MRVELQPAYILHARPYRDTSLIVDFLTPEFGRVSAVARGVRNRKGNVRHLLNPFNRLLVSWQGRAGLKLLTATESDGHAKPLQGNYLYSGFYLNELLVRLLPDMDPHPAVFEHYENSLQALRTTDALAPCVVSSVEPCLRAFEFQLLAELGYAVDFTCDAHNHQPIDPAVWYAWELDVGFVAALALAPGQLVVKGEHLVAMAAGDYRLPETRQAAKRLARRLLQPLLGHRPLKSRELFNRSIQTAR